jgi:hypothetical protein
MLCESICEDLNSNVNKEVKCIKCRIGKDGSVSPYGNQLNWWEDVFDLVEYLEEIKAKNLKTPYNKLYKVSINSKVKYFLLSL